LNRLTWRPVTRGSRAIMGRIAQHNPTAAIDLDLGSRPRQNARRSRLHKAGASSLRIVVRPGYVMVYRVTGDVVECRGSCTQRSSGRDGDEASASSRASVWKRRYVTVIAWTGLPRTRLLECARCGHSCQNTSTSRSCSTVRSRIKQRSPIHALASWILTHVAQRYSDVLWCISDRQGLRRGASANKATKSRRATLPGP
jgi:hypothetical protein